MFQVPRDHQEILQLEGRYKRCCACGAACLPVALAAGQGRAGQGRAGQGRANAAGGAAGATGVGVVWV